jgi:hypothetical protein
VVTWALVIIFLMSVTILPSPWRYIVVVAYIIYFPIMIFRFATLHQLLRVVDERQAKEGEPR